LEYCCATGMSFFTTDTKGDVFRDYALVSEKYYGYTSYIIDLRNALKSHNYNLLQLTNKYMDMYHNTKKHFISSQSRTICKNYIKNNN
ncbi:MAG: type IV secretory system conjugative DNA transfer family protein, partial [Acutalibacteraceae bacterium]|nr:type IV secretory system conjugative DNA transfer family protein [Acutalibacteraceae bacterium]